MGTLDLRRLVLAGLAVLLQAAIRAKVMNLTVFMEYLFSRLVLEGAINSLMLGTTALLLDGIVGLVAALMRVSGNPILTAFASTYIYLFRGTPMLIQLIFWFNTFPIMFPQLHVAIPFTSWVLLDAPMTSVITPHVAALIGLSLAEGAYMAEIIRGGFLAVDSGQRGAKRAIGMPHGLLMRKVVIPQAARIIVPAASSRYILLLEVHLAGLGHQLPGAAAHLHRHLCRQLPGGGAAGCRRLLVPGDDGLCHGAADHPREILSPPLGAPCP
ncbi:ABC transporter permease subunit [Acidovorax sp.]|uniref:amino acid ABC transporter permease n=1 Tax=Acidovorax sp. TaxID=1872122 RepID=UPI002ACED4E6|nr:ABC transporter permease subunit [Acidovorax sp.]MDZ7863257.1 ABC transporter permease subunit [Acidovorax sp.]